MQDPPYQHPTEPNTLNFEAHGYLCAIRRMHSGHLCGYVLVPPGHPWNGQEPDATIHGGVTWTSSAKDASWVVDPFERDLAGWWVVGFDCGHSGDVRPLDAIRYGAQDGAVYRDMEYVRGQVEQLAQQAADAEGPCTDRGERASCTEAGGDARAQDALDGRAWGAGLALTDLWPS